MKSPSELIGLEKAVFFHRLANTVKGLVAGIRTPKTEDKPDFSKLTGLAKATAAHKWANGKT